MIARKILLFLSLCVALIASIAAPSQPATQTDIQQLQQQIQVLDKELTVLKEVTANRLDSQDKRVGDLGLWTNQQANHMGAISNLSTLVGIGITIITAIIALVAGFSTYFTTKRRAIEEAEKHAASAANEWFTKNSTELKERIDELKKLASMHEEYSNLFKDHLYKVSPQILKNIDPENHNPVTLEALATVSNASQALNAKPEDQFTVDDHYVRGLNEFSAKRFESALISFQKALDKATTESVSPARHASLITAYAVALCELRRFEEALNFYDEIDQRYGNEPASSVRAQVAKALYNKSVALHHLNRPQDEIRVLDLINQRYGNDPDPAIRENVATSLLNKGITLTSLQRLEEAIATYDTLEQQFGNDSTTLVREQVTKALLNKAGRLNQLNNSEEAIHIYDRIDQRDRHDDSSSLRELVADALFSKGITLANLERSEEAIQAFDTIAQRYSADASPALRERVAKALFNKGFNLDKLKRSAEAIQVYDLVIQRYGSDDSPTLREPVAKALFYKGFALHQLERRKEAIQAFKEVIQRFASDSNTELKELVEYAQQVLDQLQGDSDTKTEPA